MQIHTFTIGKKYTRRDIRGVIGLDPDGRGGKIDTGYFNHGGAHIILSNIGIPGRTGHDYQNRFDGDFLIWSGRTGSSLSNPSVQKIINPDSEVHLFYRESDHDPFTYAGLAKVEKTEDVVPVRITWRFDRSDILPIESSPQEITDPNYYEGGVRTVTVNRYERDPSARDACVKHYGPKCKCCEIDFKIAYGEVGDGYIHVHHLTPISEIGRSYKIDPIKDLIPVCPNCHAIIHRRKPPYSIDEMKQKMSPTRR